MTNPQAKQLLAQNGKSFYWASFFLGTRTTDRAARLYQFCRFVDDLADGDLPHRSDSLEDIRAALRDFRHSTLDSVPELKAFFELSREIDIPLNAASELLDGMLRDQQPTELETEGELLRYCHAVAGTVGLMMCRVLDCQHQRANSFAIDLGVAMQLTNIARDVLEDAQMSRRYLPGNWFGNSLDCPPSPETIANAASDSLLPVSAAIYRLLQLADRYYASALLGIHLLPWRSRFAIIVALRVYRQIGHQLKRDGLQWWRGRTVVSKLTKLRISISSLWHLLPVRVPAHETLLHQHLRGLAGVD